MIWYWVVVIERGKRTFEVFSPIGWVYEESARFNLEARINQSVPNIPGWQAGDVIVSSSLVLK